MTRRSVDVVVACVALVVTAPVWIPVVMIIKADSRGPVLHRAVRVGQDQRPFTLYKFRTMAPDAALTGPGLTGRGDPRVTRIGRFLRKTKLDELPQLINLLNGDMTLVGPRPEDPRYASLYTPNQQAVFTYKPGITSPASVLYRHEEGLLQQCSGDDIESFYVQTLLPAKIDIDMRYLESRTAISDLRVVVRTATSLLSKEPPARIEA